MGRQRLLSARQRCPGLSLPQTQRGPRISQPQIAGHPPDRRLRHRPGHPPPHRRGTEGTAGAEAGHPLYRTRERRRRSPQKGLQKCHRGAGRRGGQKGQSRRHPHLGHRHSGTGRERGFRQTARPGHRQSPQRNGPGLCRRADNDAGARHPDVRRRRLRQIPPDYAVRVAAGTADHRQKRQFQQLFLQLDARLQLLLRPGHPAAGQRENGQGPGENHQTRRPQYTQAGISPGFIITP